MRGRRITQLAELKLRNQLINRLNSTGVDGVLKTFIEETHRVVRQLSRTVCGWCQKGQGNGISFSSLMGCARHRVSLVFRDSRYIGWGVGATVVVA